MKKTFVCDGSMLITIPIGSLKDAQEGQLMPEKFRCVYRDFYKIFVIRGKPQPLGAAQFLAGLFIVSLGLIFIDRPYYNVFLTLPSFVFVVSGALSYAAGQFPNMRVAKLSFSLNIVSLFWSVVDICLYGNEIYWHNHKLHATIFGLIINLLIVEMLIALFLIYWLSKAICRDYFNTLPIVLLKQAD